MQFCIDSQFGRGVTQVARLLVCGTVVTFVNLERVKLGYTSGYFCCCSSCLFWWLGISDKKGAGDART